MDLSFWKSKNVLITGHTGFKGSWLCKTLKYLGANVTGYALEPEKDPNLFSICCINNEIDSNIGDIRNYEQLNRVFDLTKPEIVFHMAAQPIVLESYKNPVYTYDVNVMGTINILECIRNKKTVKSFLNVTTDKVYYNTEEDRGYKETDILDGYDPYSNSKSCSELATSSYKRSFFNDGGVAISTARSGNVIGGGDFSTNRVIPDCIRATIAGNKINIRNPKSIRPYQHVLEPLFAYLLIVQKQYENPEQSGCYNVGPDYSDCVETGRLADLFCKAWGDSAEWEHMKINEKYEAGYLRLDCTKLKTAFNWKPKWTIETAIGKTVEWTKAWQAGNKAGNKTDNKTAVDCMEKQVQEYIS